MSNILKKKLIKKKKIIKIKILKEYYIKRLKIINYINNILIIHC